MLMVYCTSYEEWFLVGYFVYQTRFIYTNYVILLCCISCCVCCYFILLLLCNCFVVISEFLKIKPFLYKIRFLLLLRTLSIAQNPSKNYDHKYFELSFL